MAAHLITLKLRLLRGALRASTWQVVGTVVAYLSGASAALLLLAFGLVSRTLSEQHAEWAVVLGGSLLVLGWSLVPLVAFGVDETLDPSRFSLLPLRGRDLVPGLAVAGLLGAPGLALLSAGIASVLVWTRGIGPLLVSVPAAVLGVLTCLLASRVGTTAAARVLSGRRARDVTSVVTVVVLSCLGLVPMLALAIADAGLDVDTVVAALGWTPLGAAWAAPAAAASGEEAGTLARLALATAVVVALAAGWAALLDRHLTQPPVTTGGGAAVAGRSMIDRVPASPTWAVAARSWIYLRRDPRYMVALLAPAVVIVMSFALVLAADEGSWLLLALGPLVAVILGLAAANDVGYDGSAFAAHVIVGLPGVADRAGRAASWLVLAVPVTVATTVAGSIVAGQAGLAAGLVGVCVAVLLGSAGTSAVTGALAPYPVPEAGTNPFRANTGTSLRATLAQLGVTAVALVTAALPAAIVIFCAVRDTGWAWVGLPVGCLTGGALLAGGLRAGGSVVDSRAPEMLEAVRRRP